MHVSEVGGQLGDLPFDIEAASDEEVLAALAEHHIVWHNTLTGAFEYGACPPVSSKHYRITESKEFANAGERTVHFCDATDLIAIPTVQRKKGYLPPGGPFRAFKLSNLLQVKG